MLKRFLLASVAFLAVAPDSAVLAAAIFANAKMKGPAPGAIILWNIAERQQLQELKHEGQVSRALVFSAGGKSLQSAGDGVFRWWDLGSGKEERTWKPFGD